MVVGEVEAVELLQCLPAGFEAGVGVEEGVEAGPVGVGEGVTASQQREPGSEHFGVDGGGHTIAPPERIRYGPAHAPDPQPTHGGPPQRVAQHPGAGPIALAAPDRVNLAESPLAEAQQPEPLFTLA